MGRVGRDVSQEGFARRNALTDETLRFAEKYIRAEPFEFFRGAIAEIRVIEIGIIPEIRRLPDPATGVAHDVLKSAIFGAVGISVTQMPLAEHARGITIVSEDIAHRDGPESQHGATHDRVPRSRPVRVMSTQQSAAGRRAGRTDMIIGESHTFLGQPIDGRCFQVGITRAAQVAVTLVIGHNEDHIGRGRLGR